MSRAVSKAQTAARCSELLRRGPRRIEGDDFVFLLTDVFPRHEHWSEKKGAGVSHVEVRRHGTFNSNGFWIVRTDGSECDISYRAALNGCGTQSARARSAARSEITGQVGIWKEAHQAPASGMHADHVEPFDLIWRAWLAHVELSEEDISVTSQSVGHVDLFLERALAKSWQAFHRRRATYQWLTAKANIEKSNRSDGHDLRAGWIADYEAAE